MRKLSFFCPKAAAMERGVARILLATTTRRGSKLDRIAIEALGATGEARRVDLAAAWTGARGRMLTDEDARDIIAGRACSCVRVRRHAVVGRASQWTRVSASVSANLEARFQAAGNNRHLHRPTHDGVTGETPGEEAEEGKRSRTSPGGSRLHALLHLQRQPRGSHRLAVAARPKRRCNH